MRRLLFFIVLAVFLSWMPSASRADIKKLERKIQVHQKSLESVNKKIQDIRNEEKKLKQEEAALSEKLKKIDREIQRSTKKQVEIGRDMRGVELKIGRLGKKLDLYSNEAKMAESFLLADLRDFHSRYVFPNRLNTAIRFKTGLSKTIMFEMNELQKITLQREMTNAEQTELLAYRKQLLGLKENLNREIKKQKDTKEEKKHLLQSVLGKKIAAEQEAANLKQTSQQLEVLVKQLRAKRDRSLAQAKEEELLKKSLAERKGHYAYPVQGSIVSRYGKQKHPDLNISVINNGIRIKTGGSREVRPIEKGRVVYASDFRSYGQTVIVDHGGELFSIYGMLGEILVKEGDKVSHDKVLGRSDDSSDSQVYFEIRVHGEAEDPFTWIK